MSLQRCISQAPSLGSIGLEDGRQMGLEAVTGGDDSTLFVRRKATSCCSVKKKNLSGWRKAIVVVAISGVRPPSTKSTQTLNLGR